MANPLNSSCDESSSDEVILITGAGGSIGSAIARKLSMSAGDRTTDPVAVRARQCCAPAWQDVNRTMVLLDHSEQNLYEIDSELKSADASAHQVPILGDVNDAPLLNELFEKYRPTHIFHAAAFKHVPLMEENPIAVIRNNVLGTWTLAVAALKHRAHRLTMISTDKAAIPHSVMGAAKRVAELVLAHLDSPATHMRSLRLGNVLGSTGSVVRLFQRQIQIGGPVTVTHPEASRYFVSLDEATNLILATAALEDTGTLFVPELDAPVRILDLAKKLICEAGASLADELSNRSPRSASNDARQIEILFTGLRPGDKLQEDLLSSTETAERTAHPKLRRICGPTPSSKSLDSAISLISEKVWSRDLPALIDAIRNVVPEYQPSEALTSVLSTQLSAAKI